MKRISVIVPIRNEEKHIEQTLRQLLDQDTTGLKVEILVVDGQSTDQTRDVVLDVMKNNPSIRLFENPLRRSSAARNVGIKNSSGDYLVIVDGHCEIRNRRYFVDMVEAFERTQADCLGRPQPLNVTDATRMQAAIAAARNSRLGHHPDSYIYSNQELKVPAISVAVAYRKEVFEQLGLFDERFDACEDCEFNHRIDEAGLTCFLIPSLAIHYKPRKTLSGLFYQLTRYGRGRVRMGRKHKSSLTLSSIIPALFVLGLLVGPLLSLVFPILWYVYFGVIALYVLIVGTFSFQALKTSTFATAIRLPFVFATIHIASGWGVVREFFTPAKSANVL